MEEVEFEDVLECVDCGESAFPESCFWLAERSVLCFECSIRRGGQYHARTETWVLAPDLTGLPVIQPEEHAFQAGG